MENWDFGSYYFVLLLLIIPILAILAWKFSTWKKNKREQFAEHRFHPALFENNSSFFSQKWFFTLFFLGLLSLIIAIIDIIGGKETVMTTQKTGNILFAVDVSNSMNTEDLPNNRLSMAKNIIINTLPNLGTDRVGIIVFAGEAKSIMPLTTDYSGAEFYINAIETSMMKTQGTDFLNAVREATNKFKNIEKGNRKLILLSDGEDNEESTQNAIDLAKKEGISIISIGIGTDEGAPIPVYMMGQLMGYKTNLNGETVLSQRQTQALKQLAQDTGGAYIDGNSLEKALAELQKIIKHSGKNSTEISVKSENYEHFFQYPLALSIICFFFIFLFRLKD